MFSTPFCTHSFSEEQLAELEWVVCPCGYHYRSDLLRDYAKKNQAFVSAKSAVELLVQTIARESAAHKGDSVPVYQAAPAAPVVAAPPRPQRTRANVSISQWLIISASILVLIAASVFVQGNRESFSPTTWLIIEGVLGAAAVAGTIYGRKMSVLLANFLAVFSAGMLMSFIMTLGTQLGLGFTEFDQEPSWFWAVNLTLVSAATSVAAITTKNFGWRALSPVTLAIAGLILTYGAVGDAIKETPTSFGWQLITLSATAIALLTQLKFLRNISQVVSANSEDKAYEEDLHKREDSALQQFATYTTILLAVVGAGVTLLQVLGNIFTPFDYVATLSLGAFWLLGSATIDIWGGSLSRSGVVAKKVKTATWTIAYVSIGVGLNALTVTMDHSQSLLVALGATLVLTTLPRYARFVKPPMITLNATSWSILATWALWNLHLGSYADAFAFAIYLFGFAVVTVAADLISKSKSGNVTALVATSLSAILAATTWFNQDVNDYESWFVGGIGVLVLLLVANFSALTSDVLAKRTKTEKPSYIAWVTLPVGFVASFIFAWQSNFHFNDRYETNIGIMVAYLVWAIGAQALNHRKPALTRELQSLAALASAVLVAAVSGFDNPLTLQAGLVFVAFAIVGYGFGYAEKRAVKLQVGLASLVVGLFIALSSNHYTQDVYSDQALRFALLFALLPVAIAGHNYVIKKRTTISSAANTATNLVVLLAGSALAPIVTIWANSDRNSNWVWAFLTLGLTAYALLELPFARKDSDNALQLRVAGIAYLTFGLFSVWQSSWMVESDTNHLRQVIFSAAIVAVTWRTILATKQALWSISSYIGSVVLALVAGDWIMRSGDINWEGPEITAVILAALLAVNGYVINRAASTAHLWLISDIPVFVAVLPSVVYASLHTLDSNEGIARLLGVGVIVGAYGYWRALQSKNPAWVAVGYTGLGLAAAMTVQEFKFNLELDLRGPELYAVAVLATTFLGTRVLRGLGALKGTLVTWGVPLAVAVLPSAIYSYDAVTSRFEELDALQISRVIAVLVVSGLALVLGMRAGNLGAASAGTAGLTLTAIPNLWFRFDGVAEGAATIELRALLIGFFLFLILAVSKQFKLTRGNSVIFIGIPTMVALAPALANTFQALNNPSFTTIDWWRFAIVLSISLTLLVVGSLRELGGMFYPGFAGVMVAALPYGFRQIDGAAWLLWIILLLVAGTLIWLATRIEKMRKQGRTPAMWLKELK